MAGVEESLIYKTEPMATRALAAEIRHDHSNFVQLLEHRAGVASFGTLKSVSCEGEGLIDVQLNFENSRSYRVGIEAKLDHEFSKEQLEKQLKTMDLLFLLLPKAEAAPSWLPSEVKVVTWAETLECFTDSRLTLADIHSAPLQKSTLAIHLERLREDILTPKLGAGWNIDVRRLNGKPACWFESPLLPDGRRLQGDLQIHGWGMPTDISVASFKYFIAVSVTEEGDFPDPGHSEEIPGWIKHLRVLQSEVLEGKMDRFLVSRSNPKSGRSTKGKNKIRLAKEHLGDHLYLTQGYVPWVLGIRSIEMSFESLDELADVAAEIITRWYAAETIP